MATDSLTQRNLSCALPDYALGFAQQDVISLVSQRSKASYHACSYYSFFPHLDFSLGEEALYFGQQIVRMVAVRHELDDVTLSVN